MAPLVFLPGDWTEEGHVLSILHNYIDMVASLNSYFSSGIPAGQLLPDHLLIIYLAARGNADLLDVVESTTHNLISNTVCQILQII